MIKLWKKFFYLALSKLEIVSAVGGSKHCGSGLDRKRDFNVGGGITMISFYYKIAHNHPVSISLCVVHAQNPSHRAYKREKLDWGSWGVQGNNKTTLATLLTVAISYCFLLNFS